MQNNITDAEFAQFQRFIFDNAGISLAASKKALVCGRLSKRLSALQLTSYTEYMKFLASGRSPAEVQTAIDLLTTNETYFFREPKHFELLKQLAGNAASRSQPMRVWSAACSTGEEPYSIAMVLAEEIGNKAGWEVVGTDISTRVLQRARAGHYPMERARLISPGHLKKFCLKGHGEFTGTLLVDKAIRERTSFLHVNLNADLPRLGNFDVIFLRNVMIYFNGDTKRQVVSRVLSLLKPGGYFCIGHSESLNDITSAVEQVAPSIYRKP